MKMKSDDVYVLHISDAITDIERYVQGMSYQDFQHDTKTQDAVIRKVTILGEATKKLSEEFKDRYPDIPWKSIAGTRDKLIHDYFDVDIKLLWEILELHLPSLKTIN